MYERSDPWKSTCAILLFSKFEFEKSLSCNFDSEISILLISRLEKFFSDTFEYFCNNFISDFWLFLIISVWTATFKSVPLIFVVEKSIPKIFALVKSAPPKSAPPKSAFCRLASLKSAFCRLAEYKLLPWKLAPLSEFPEKSDPIKFDSSKFVICKTAFPR